jgi:hypothetical protein
MADQHQGRRFNDGEIAQILKRASEIQQSEPGDQSRAGLSLSELEQVAGEAGIDPLFVRRAAADLDAAQMPQRESAFVGAPTLLQFERIVDGEVPESEYEMLVEEIRRTFSITGIVTTLGRSLAWTSAASPRPDTRIINVSVVPRNGVTTIRVEEQLQQRAAATFVGTMGVGGAGTMFAIVAALKGAFFAVAAPLGLGITCLSYITARLIYQSLVNRRTRDLLQLLDRLTTYAVAVARRDTMLEADRAIARLGRGAS